VGHQGTQTAGTPEPIKTPLTEGMLTTVGTPAALKVHKIENFFDSDFGICVISLLVMSKY
jgi:hypothetical protein